MQRERGNLSFSILEFLRARVCVYNLYCVYSYEDIITLPLLHRMYERTITHVQEGQPSQPRIYVYINIIDKTNSVFPCLNLCPHEGSTFRHL